MGTHFVMNGNEYEIVGYDGSNVMLKDFIVYLLKKAGIKLGFKLTDNDIRYMLWRSYKNLTEGGHRSVFDVAKDVQMREKV